MENLTILIPFFNGHSTLYRLIDSLPPDTSILLIDDHSDQPLQRLPWMGDHIRIVRPRQKGYFAGAVNEGIRQTSTDVLVLNQDTWFEWHPEGSRPSMQEKGGAWQRLISDYRGRYALIGERIKGVHPAFPEGYIHGTFMFMRRDAIQAVGLLNGQEYPLWGCTAEWQWRAARKGFQVLPLPVIEGFRHERRPDQRFGSSIRTILEREPTQERRFTQTPPLVSVVVPCYNYGRYLADCLASLLGGPSSLGPQPGQTLQSFEVVIVDDASTDDSAAIGERLADVWKGVRFFRMEQNVGTARTLNFAISQAVGEYITFLSADDMRTPESLEAMVKVAREHPHSFVYDDIQMFGEGRLLRTWRMEEFDAGRLLSKNHIHAGILYPRQAWLETGGYPPQMDDGREDWAFNIALTQAGYCGVHLRGFGYLYRREGQNRSLTNMTPTHHDYFLAKIQRIFPSLYDQEYLMKGDHPMRSCCGGGGVTRPAKKTSNGAAAAALVAGNEDMVRLEYLGAQQVSVWAGPTTHTPYRFGATKRIGWVYRSDVGSREGKGFLGLRKNGEFLFALYQEPAPASEPSVAFTAPVPEGAGIGSSAVGGSQDDGVGATGAANAQAVLEAAIREPVKELGFAPVTIAPAASTLAGQAAATIAPDPSLYTADQMEHMTLTPDQWRTVYELEQAGKKRKTVLERAQRLSKEASNASQ